jgi:hypothetical protein
MTLRVFALLATSVASYAQTPNVDPSQLPQITVGAGPSWTRGAAYAASADINVAVRFGSSNIFSWSTISTPVAKVPVGSPALASTITTGLAYVAAQTANGRASLITIAQGGVNSVQPSGPVSAAFTGSVGLAVKLGRGMYLMPYIRASNPQRGVDGALISTVVQPGVMLMMGFSGGK